MTDRLPFVIGNRPLQGNFDAVVSRLRDLDVAAVAAAAQAATWKTIAHNSTVLAAAVGAGNFYTPLTGGPIASGAGYATIQSAVPLRAADYAVAGKVTQLRLIVVTMTNGTDDGRTVTHGLYPFTHSGAAGNGVVTLGTVVSGSTVAINSTTNEARVDAGSAFDFPADGAYILGFQSSGAGVANSLRTPLTYLQLRHV